MNQLIENYGLDPQAITCLTTYFDMKATNRDFEDNTLYQAIEASSWAWAHFDSLEGSEQHTVCQLFISLIDTSREHAIKKEVRERLITHIFKSSLLSQAIGKVSLFLTPAYTLNLVSQENARQCELIVKMGIVFKEKLPHERIEELNHLDQLIAVALGQQGAIQEQAKRIRELLHPSSAIPRVPPTCGAVATARTPLPQSGKNRFHALTKQFSTLSVSSAASSTLLNIEQFCLVENAQESIADPKTQAKLELLTNMLEQALLKHAPALFSNYSEPMKETLLSALKASLPRLSAFLFTTDPRNLAKHEKLLFEKALSAAYDFLVLFVKYRNENSSASVEQIIDKILAHNNIAPDAFSEQRWIFLKDLIVKQLESNTEYLPRPDGLKQFMQTVACITGFLLFEEYVSPVWIQKALGRMLTGPVNLNPFANTSIAASPPTALFDASDEQFSNRIGELINQLITTIASYSTTSLKASVITKVCSFFKTEIGKAIQQSLNKLLNTEVSMTPFLAFYHLMMTEENSTISSAERQEKVFQLIKKAMQSDSIAKRIPNGWETIVKNTISLLFSIIENEKAVKCLAFFLLKSAFTK